MQNFSGEPLTSCIVLGKVAIAFTASSPPMCSVFTIFSPPPLNRVRFRDPPFNHGGHSSFFWFGISFECWKPCIRARAGMDVFAEKENVADGWYASLKAERWLSNRGKNLMRKLLMKVPSTPVIKGGIISVGKVVAVGRVKGGPEVDAWGTSNAILTIGSWSSISSEGNRRATSLFAIE